jgi:cbb3-type cytochrome oxidase maturation protein
MYYPYFLAYMISGFVISLVVLFWALRNGQFKDQQRARFLPLEDKPETGPARLSRMGRWQAVILVALACSGLVATAVAIVISLVVAGGSSG